MSTRKEECWAREETASSVMSSQPLREMEVRAGKIAVSKTVGVSSRQSLRSREVMQGQQTESAVTAESVRSPHMLASRDVRRGHLWARDATPSSLTDRRLRLRLVSLFKEKSAASVKSSHRARAKEVSEGLECERVITATSVRRLQRLRSRAVSPGQVRAMDKTAASVILLQLLTFK